MAGEKMASRLVGGRYRLVEPLGRGGMGTVWLARDELLRRSVAVKHVAIPSLDATDRPPVRERVIREARAAARLGHPATVTVFDVVEEDGNVYIVMELVDAATLADVVARRGPLSVEVTARIGLELVGALDAAHRQGIVHRDVKPSNVMLPAAGVKLADFGIASVKDHPSVTGTGQVLGSPSYMAPEQALSAASGEQVDWWALGATLYFAVEGRPPFERDGALATLTAVVHEEPAPAHRAGPLNDVLRRLLDKDPAARPSAPELRKVLRQLAAVDRRPAAAGVDGATPPLARATAMGAAAATTVVEPGQEHDDDGKALDESAEVEPPVPPATSMPAPVPAAPVKPAGSEAPAPARHVARPQPRRPVALA
ncbi:MAG: protein kinase domain-containing protein, partial [Acidimicrobiales bacterium]